MPPLSCLPPLIRRRRPGLPPRLQHQTAHDMTNARPLLPLALLLALALAAPAHPADAQSLRGSRGSVNRMYHHATDHGIYFYKTGKGIRDAGKAGRFVRLGGGDYRLAGVSYPYVRAETRTFVERLASQYRSACGERLVVTSAARPKSMRLANSVDRSVHPTGMAIDLRKPTRRACLSWLRETLLYLERQGVVEATEERSPPHFHVAVFPSPYTRYVQGRGGRSYASASAEASYRVRSGDSLWGIARRHGTTVAQLKEVNGLRSSRLKVGQRLVIPAR